MTRVPRATVRAPLFVMLALGLLLHPGCKGNLSKYDSEGEGSTQTPERSISGGTFLKREGSAPSSGGMLARFGRGVVRSDGSIDPGRLCEVAARCIPGESVERCTSFTEENPPTGAETRQIAQCIDTSTGCKELLSCLGVSPEAVEREAKRRRGRAQKK